MNGYPQRLIRHRPQQKHRVDSQQQWNGVAVVLCFRGLSESVRCILSPFGVKVYFRSHTTNLRQIFPSPKEKPDTLEPCKDCNACYIGQTGRELNKRLKEHKRAVIAADFNTSALAEHA